MTAAEATGIRVSRRIFRHLIPNVIPQLVVFASMGIGDVILAESTLSFLVLVSSIRRLPGKYHQCGQRLLRYDELFIRVGSGRRPDPAHGTCI